MPFNFPTKLATSVLLTDLYSHTHTCTQPHTHMHTHTHNMAGTTTGLSIAAIVGIAIAAILAAIIALLIFFCFVACCCVLCRHSQSKAISSPQPTSTSNEYIPHTVPQRQQPPPQQHQKRQQQPQQQKQQQKQQQQHQQQQQQQQQLPQYSIHEPLAHRTGYPSQAPPYLAYSGAPPCQQEVGRGGADPYSPQVPPAMQFLPGTGIEGVTPYSLQPAPLRGTLHSLSAYPPPISQPSSFQQLLKHILKAFSSLGGTNPRFVG